MLLQQLAARFGAVPAAMVARIEEATADEIERWSLRVRTAASTEETLAED